MTSRPICALLSGIILLLARPMLAQTPGTWSLAGNMSTTRGQPTLALLPDGTVLAAGGTTTSTNTDIYNPATNTWSLTGPMTTARFNQAGTALADGRVLVAGGWDASGTYLSSAEIYDPSTQTWTPTGSMNTPRYQFSTTLLPNGEVLAAGGWDVDNSVQGATPLSSSELWNPATGQWTLTGSMAFPSANHIAIPLSNGTVVIIEGGGVELYNSSTGAWTSPPGQNGIDPFGPNLVAALMSNGQVLVAGGSAGGCCAGLADAGLVVPATAAWTTLEPMTTGRQAAAASAILNGNQVLVSGGWSCCSDPYETRPSTEFYDLTTQEWHLTGSFNAPRANHSVVTLPDGSVLAVGGSQIGGSSLASAERYYPSSSPPQTVTVELAVNVGATSLSVAGTGCSPGTYTAYQTAYATLPMVPINWTPGSSCEVDVPPPSGFSFTSWSDGSTANPRTFVAPTTATTYTANFTQGGSGGSSGPAAIQATGGTPQSATVNTAFASQLSVTVTDSSGNGVSGVAVTFTPPSSGASGTFSGVNTATTNISGAATSAVFTANGTAGSYAVVASVAGLSSTASFSLTNTPAGSGGNTTTTLVPSSYVTTGGSTGGQPVASSIDLLDESGTANNWNKYVEFDGKYAGYQIFTLPATIAPASVNGIQVEVNYQGPAASSQTWTWRIYDWVTASYVTVGTNAGAPDWGAWKLLTFAVPGTLSDYIRSTDGQIRIQLVSNNSADSADIDYEAVIVSSQ